MATLRSVLVLAALCVAMSQETCNTQTAGKCNIIGCYAERGPTDCVGSFPSKVCVCQPHFCTNADKSKCVPEFVPTPYLKEGDAVQVQDQTSDVATAGTVIKTKPLEVKPDGCKQHFAWNIVKHKPPLYKVGDAVEARDSNDDEWKVGMVTQVSEDGVEVRPTLWATSFSFQQVRPRDWQRLAADKAAAGKKALAQFAAALEKVTADAAAAQKASDDAGSISEKMAVAADAKKELSYAAADKLPHAKEEEAQYKSDEVAKDKAAKLAAEKKDAAHQAAETARGAQAAAENKAATEASASEEAQEAASKKKAEVKAQQAQETQEADVVKSSLKQAKDEEAKGNEAMASAMYAAYDQARNARDATQRLVLELQGQQAAADARAARAARASSDAQKDAAIKKNVAQGAASEEAQETRNSEKAAQLAATATKAAGGASAARKQAAQAAAAAKEASDAAITEANAATAKFNAVLAQSREWDMAKETAAGKNRCALAQFGPASQKASVDAAAAQTSQVILFQKAEPKNHDSSPMLLVTAFFAAVAMIMMIAWRSTRFGGNVVMPETLLG